LSPKNIIKKQSILGKNYYSRPSFTKSTSLPTTIVEKKKNEWCYLLLTYVLHCKKKKKKQGQVHQTNAVKAESNWPQPILCVRTVQH